MKSTDEPRPSSSKGRALKILLWSGAALFLATTIAEIAWLRVWLQKHPRTVRVTEEQPAGAAPAAGSATVRPGDNAGANSVSITLNKSVVEDGIQLLVLAGDPTTPEVI